MKISEILAERKLFEISRRDFLKGAGAAAGLAAVGKAGADGNNFSGKDFNSRETQRAAKDQALKDLIRQDALVPAGLPGGVNNSYIKKLRACIMPGVAFPTPPRKGTENPTVHFRISLDDGTGLVDGIKLIKSSGNDNFDRGVKTGILRCNPLPKPPKSPDGKYPPYIDINYKMYD
jgi:colicin import membrane protein